MKAVLAVIDFLIALFPAKFRRSFGREIRADFVDRWNERAVAHERIRRVVSLTALSFATVWNLIVTNVTERARSSVLPRKKRNPLSVLNRGLTSQFNLDLRPESLLQDVRYAIRGLLNQPAFTTAVVALLGIGIGANVAMFSAFNQTLLRPLPYQDPGRLVLGRTTFNGNVNPDMSALDIFDFRDRSQVFESVGAIRTDARNATVTGGDEPEQVSYTIVSWDLFPTLGISAIRGRHFTSGEGEAGAPNVMIMSGGYWMRRFGADSDIIGKAILVDGTARTVVGVMPPDFSFMHDVDIWLPQRRDAQDVSRGWHSWLMVARMRPAITIQRARADVDLIAAQLAAEYPETNRDKALLLTELQAAMAEDYRSAVVLLMAAVGMVLLIACGNVASLLLARGAARRQELCVRAALGASAVRIARQLLTESMVTAAAGGALGTALAFWMQRLISHVAPVDLPGMHDLGISWPMLAFALAVSLVTGLLFGGIPAVQAARMNVAENVRSGVRTTDSPGQRMHGFLVIVQVAASVILLIGSGLLLKSFNALRSVQPGFDTNSLLTTEIRLTSDEYADAASRLEFFTTLSDRMHAIPGVTDVAASNQLPIRDPGNNLRVYAADRPAPDPNDRPSSYWRSVLPGYFEAMGIPLIRGRGIEASDIAEAQRVLVINETMARTLFPDEDPIGKPVNVQREVDYEVVGVVGDVRVSGPRYIPRMTMYVSYLQHPTLVMRFAIRSTLEPASLANTVKNSIWSNDRNIPMVGLESMESIIARSVSNDKVVAVAVTLFAAVAVLLAALGLYGVLAYYVTRRTHEIGVRVALGAGTISVLTQVLRQGLRLASIGIALGLIGAFWASRLLQQILFEVAPTDVPTFAVVCLLFALVALGACLFPALKALRVDPMRSLTVQ